MGSVFDALKWEGNSLMMYESILREVPPPFRNNVRRSIASWLVKNRISVVTEEIVFRAVRDIAPRRLADRRILPELEKLRTTPQTTAAPQ